MNAQESRKKISELVNDAKLCMLTTINSEDRMVARPMGLQEMEFDGDLWFFTFDESGKVHDISLNPKVNVSFSDPKHNSWTSISGTAETSHDRDRMEQLWNPMLKAWFPDGIETNGICLLKVHADSAEYWDAPDSKVVTLIGMAKAAVTGDQAKTSDFGGENKKVEL